METSLLAKVIVPPEQVRMVDSFEVLDTFKENATTLIDEIVAPLNAAKVPFSSSYGVHEIHSFEISETQIHLQNHDNQVNITHAEEITREQKVAPLSYTRSAPSGIGGEEGPGNYWVPVRDIASSVFTEMTNNW